MHDTLRLAFIVGITTTVIGMVCLGYVTFSNSSSRNLVLAWSALAGAIVLFGIQLPFELRSTSVSEFISTEFTIDRAAPEIRQWDYPPKTNWRLLREVEASKYLASRRRDAFDEDREKVTLNMAQYSLLAYFANEHFDWQLKKTTYRGQTKTQIRTEFGSKPEECTIIKEQDLQDLLARSGNYFSGAPVFAGIDRLCLPPGSQIYLAQSELKITNPFSELIFQFEMPGSVNFMKPKSKGQVPVLPGKAEAQFETRFVGIRTRVEYSRLRAHNLDMPKYQDWCKRVLEGAKTWFEGV